MLYLSITWETGNIYKQTNQDRALYWITRYTCTVHMSGQGHGWQWTGEARSGVPGQRVDQGQRSYIFIDRLILKFYENGFSCNLISNFKLSDRFTKLILIDTHTALNARRHFSDTLKNLDSFFQIKIQQIWYHKLNF